MPSYLLPNPGVTYDGRYGDWDRNGSGSQYIGAGLIQLDGSTFSITVKPIDTGIPSNGQFRNWMWWNATSVIYTTPGPQYHGPEKPTLKTTTTRYHHDVTHAKK